MSRTLSACLPRHSNNYNMLRLLLAISVIFGHSFAIQGGNGWIDPVQEILGFCYSGSLAVNVFFLLSGIFVTESMLERQAILSFVIKRAARIFPALFICLLMTVFVVGLIFSDFQRVDYLADPETLSYITRNMALGDLQWRLPGVFVDSRWGLNGSLWTLPTEGRLYLCIAVLYAIGSLRKPLSASLAIVIGVLLFHEYAAISASLDREQWSLIYFFAAGALAAVNKIYIPVTVSVAALLSVVAVSCWQTPMMEVATYAAITYWAIYLFSLPVVSRLSVPGDFSYGVYLYGFVAQQVFSHVVPSAGPLINAAVCIPVCVGLGALSWHLVERPSLLFSERLIGWCRQVNREQFTLASARPLLLPLAIGVVLAFLPQSLRLWHGRALPMPESDLRVTAFGPTPVTHGLPFNIQPNGASAIWVRVSRLAVMDAKLVLGGNPLTTVVEGNLLTAAVPSELFAHQGNVPLVVEEPIAGRKISSLPVDWIVQ